MYIFITYYLSFVFPNDDAGKTSKHLKLNNIIKCVKYSDKQYFPDNIYLINCFLLQRITPKWSNLNLERVIKTFSIICASFSLAMVMSSVYRA